MTKRNNYDKSSTGTDIECICAYDFCQARWLWEENFKSLETGRNGTAKAYYIDHGNVPDETEINFSVKGEKEEKVRFLVDNLSFEKEEIETWPDNTIDDEIMGQYGTIDLTTFEDCNQYMFKGYALEIVTNKKIDMTIIRGYSQGEYCEVFYCPDDLEKAWGKKPDERELKKLFTNLFYDAPIYARFTINGEEYNYCDMPEADKYDWKRDEFLQYVSEKSGVPVETISEFLPEHPDYE
jgi:hypothetical protein